MMIRTDGAIRDGTLLINGFALDDHEWVELHLFHDQQRA